MRIMTAVNCCDQQVFDCFFTGTGLCVEGLEGMRIHGELCGPTGPGRICVKANPDSRVRSPVGSFLPTKSRWSLLQKGLG